MARIGRAAPVTRVTIVSSLPATRAGLERLIEGDDEIELSAEAEVIIIAEEPMWRGLLDELLADPGSKPAPILVGDDEVELRFFASRASGHGGWAALPAAVSGGELRRAVHAVAQGLVVVHPALLDSMVELRFQEPQEPAAALSEREREVLDLMSRGFSNPEIAGLLGISEHTVKFHTSSLYAKLGVANRTEAVRAGIRVGAIHL
jgi:DNA-binding CsgD family transcriptional regulator